MADLNQDDIDALLNGISSDDSASVPEAPAADGPMDQSAIDALLGGGGDPAPAADSGPMDQSAIDALLGGGSDPAPAADSGPMDQSAIDALLGGGGDPAPAADSGPMDQSAIDALLGGGGGSNDPIDQSEIDALFDNSGGAASSDGGDDMAALLAEIQNDPSLDQSGGGDININELLTEIQTEVPLPSGDSMGQMAIDDLIGSVPSVEAETQEEPEEGVNVDFLLDMKLNITFEVGRSRMLIGDLLSLGQGSVIELHRLVGEDLDLFVSGRLIAKGEVVVVNEKFGVRILTIVNPEERVQKMGGLDKLV